MGIKRINEFPEGSGSLSNDDVFLFMDDPSGSGVTKKISLSEISTTIGGGGGGLSDSDRYVICKAGDDITVKYSEAKALTPGGSAKSATNRAYLIIMPGVYLANNWLINGEFVDVIGLGSSSLDRGCNVAVRVTGSNITASANNVRIKGIGTDTGFAFRISGDKPLQIFEECQGGTFISDDTVPSFGGFGSNSLANGTFINCIGGTYSFVGGGGLNGLANGTFINCIGGASSFASSAEANGTFINCTGGASSFGGLGNANGTFTNCIGGANSFGGGGAGTANGTFKDCTGGASSFGGGGAADGTFTNCTGGASSFGGVPVSNGRFTDCTGGANSFGDSSGVNGLQKLIRCIITSGSFPPAGVGQVWYRLCIDGNYNIINTDGIGA